MVAAGLGGRRVPEDARGGGGGGGRRQPLPRLCLLHLVWGRPHAPQRTEPRNVLVGTRVENEARRGRGVLRVGPGAAEAGHDASRSSWLACLRPLCGAGSFQRPRGVGGPSLHLWGRPAAGNPGCWALRGIRLCLLAPHLPVHLRAGLLLGTLRPGLRLTLIQCLPPLQLGPICGHRGLERRHTGASRRRCGFGSRPLPCSKCTGKPVFLARRKVLRVP